MRQVHGLHQHADVLRRMFEKQGAPTAEIVRQTWHYVQVLDRMNNQLAAARSAHGGTLSSPRTVDQTQGHGDIGPNWVRIVSQAASAEDQLSMLTARVRTMRKSA